MTHPIGGIYDATRAQNAPPRLWQLSKVISVFKSYFLEKPGILFNKKRIFGHSNRLTRNSIRYQTGRSRTASVQFFFQLLPYFNRD